MCFRTFVLLRLFQASLPINSHVYSACEKEKAVFATRPISSMEGGLPAKDEPAPAVKPGSAVVHTAKLQKKGQELPPYSLLATSQPAFRTSPASISINGITLPVSFRQDTVSEALQLLLSSGVEWLQYRAFVSPAPRPASPM